MRAYLFTSTLHCVGCRIVRVASWFDRSAALLRSSAAWTCSIQTLFPKPWRYTQQFAELHVVACSVACSAASMQVTQEHVTAGCNRVVGALDWGNDHSVAYAAHNLICLYDAEVRYVLATFSGLVICITPHSRTFCGV